MLEYRVQISPTINKLFRWIQHPTLMKKSQLEWVLSKEEPSISPCQQ